MNKSHTRHCPLCNKTMFYSTKGTKTTANKNNSKCKSCAVKGKNNPMYGKTGSKNPFYGKRHSIETKQKLSSIFKGKKVIHSEEVIEKYRKLAKVNLVQGDVYQYWVAKYGEKIAKEKKSELKKKISKNSKGKNNPMYGKPSPAGSGNGWSGWYKNIFFRSLRELKYMLELDEKNINWKTAELKKYKVEYIDFNLNKRNYFPDFIIHDKIIIECKPKRLWNTPKVLAKKKAAEKKFLEMGLEYKLVDPGKPSNDEIKKLIETKTIILTERYQKKYEKEYK